MANIVTDLTCELTSLVKVKCLRGNLFSQDNAANTINVSVLRNGEPESLSGTITANVIRADGSTVAVSGAFDGNVAYIVLPQACYAIPGIISIAIKNTQGSTVTTIAAVITNVYQSSTDVVVDPGTIIPSIETLISQIEDAVDSIPVDYSDLLHTIADDYTSKPYAVGEYAWQAGVLKRCIVPITTAETYTDAHWTNAVLGDDVTALKSAITEQDDNTGSVLFGQNGYVSNAMPLFINNSGKYAATGEHIIIPIMPGDTVEITGNSTYTTHCAFLTQMDVPVAGNTPPFSAESGFTGRISVSTNTKYTYTTPTDAHYLYITKSVSSNDYLPKSIEVNGIDMTNSIYNRLNLMGKALFGYADLTTKGGKQSSSFVQGAWDLKNLCIDRTRSNRCASENIFKLYAGDYISITADDYTGIKFALFGVLSNGSTFDSGWLTADTFKKIDSDGLYGINVAKTNGSDNITPSDVDMTIAIKEEASRQRHINTLRKMIDVSHEYIDFCAPGEYRNNSNSFYVNLSGGYFSLNGVVSSADVHQYIRLNNEYGKYYKTGVEELETGFQLEPFAHYKLTVKTTNGYKKLSNNNRVGVVVSVYNIGETDNIGTFTQTEDTTINEFVAPATGIVNFCIYLNPNSSYVDCEGFVILEKVKTAVKGYYVEELDDTIAKVRAVNDEPGIVFPWVTDIHRFNAEVQTFDDMIDNIKGVASAIKCDFVLNSGDTIEGDQQKNTSLGQAYDSMAAMKTIGEPLFYSQGNHDNNPYISSGTLVFNIKEVFGGFFTAMKNVTFNVNENGTDFYYDFNTLGVRFISVNSCNPTIWQAYGFGPTTAEWLGNALNTDHTVILTSHVSPIKEHVWNNIDPPYADDVRTALSQFVGNGGKLIILTGHSHIDAEFVNPYVEITNVCQKFEKADTSTTQYNKITGEIDGIRNPDRTANTYTADAWSVGVYKPISNELDLIRFGAGVDRYIHCTPISSGTLTTRLSGEVTWSSSNNSIATVSDGTITVVTTGRCAIIAKDSTGNIEVWIVET